MEWIAAAFDQRRLETWRRRLWACAWALQGSYMGRDTSCWWQRPSDMFVKPAAVEPDVSVLPGLGTGHVIVEFGRPARRLRRVRAA